MNRAVFVDKDGTNGALRPECIAADLAQAAALILR
jgi:hypothetical protein